MALRVTLFCPDRHLRYDGRTADARGVGGGVTARLRLARALARRGHSVCVVANVTRPHRHHGVRFEPLDAAHTWAGDVLVLNSSGGALDLGGAAGLERGFRLTEIWVQGAPPVQGLELLAFDNLVVPSNFMLGVVRDAWGLARGAPFVAYNGVERRPRRRWPRPRRDPRRLVYTSHPNKGLAAALALLRRLRERDARLSLHLYGGSELWGGARQASPGDAGVVDHGLVGQSRLAAELERSGIALHLQAMPEGNSLGLQEAMAAGNLVVASPVGANAEVIRHGRDGFLVPGPHEEPATLEAAAQLIEELLARPEWADYVRRQARCTPLDWDTLAAAWEGRWLWSLRSPNERRAAGARWGACRACGAPLLPLADGYHCTDCGRYGRDADAA